MTFFNSIPPGVIIPFAGTTIPPGWLLCDGSAVSRTVYANLFSFIGSSWGNGDGINTFHIPDLRGRFLRGLDNGANRDPDKTTRTASNPGGNTGDNVGSIQEHDYGHNHSNTRSASSSIPNVNHSHGNTGYISHNHGHYIHGNGSHQHGMDDAHFTQWGGSMFGGNKNQDWDNGRYVHWIATYNSAWGSANHGHSTGNNDASHWHNTPDRSAGHTHVASASVTINNSGSINETRPINVNINYIIKI